MIKSNKDDDIYTHSKILHKILNSKDYKVLAENLFNINGTPNKQLGLDVKGITKYSIYNYNPLINKKEMTIKGFNCINTSFPEFLELMNSLF